MFPVAAERISFKRTLDSLNNTITTITVIAKNNAHTSTTGVLRSPRNTFEGRDSVQTKMCSGLIIAMYLIIPL